MNKKIDRGIQLSYSKLSYRRKFIRCLWTSPINVFLSILIYYANKDLVIPIILMAATIGAITFNYFSWKKEE